MKPTRTEAEILSDLDRTALEISQITLYLNGSLQKSTKRYTKKDGTVSVYNLPRVLQYNMGGKQSQMRIKAQYLPLVAELIEAGRHRRKLLSRHQTLCLELVKLRLRGDDAEKKTSGHHPHCPS